MPKLLLDIPDLAKLDEFLAHFVPNLAFIESAHVDGSDKSTYTVEDIKAIIKQFPEDKKWTFDDVEKYFPQDLPIKIEIINNQIFVRAAPSTEYESILEILRFELSLVSIHGSWMIIDYPVAVKLGEDNSVQPSTLLAKYDMIAKNFINGTPDMVLEIWSPDDSKKDKERKRNLYESKGVTEYWQIEPEEKTILVETLNEKGKYKTFSEAKEKGMIKSKVLEGFEISLEKVFSKI